MNINIGLKQDFFRYKLHMLSVLTLFCYTYLHFRMTGQYTAANFEQLINFQVKLPYGQRILTPLMARCISNFIQLDTASIFFLIEWLFTSLFYFSLKRLLEQEFSKNLTRVLSVLFFILLPLITVVNYQFLRDVLCPFYYPWDTATLFFTTLGLLLCIQQKWVLFMLVLFFSTLNKESSFILILLIPALQTIYKKKTWVLILSASFIYIAARLAVMSFVYNSPGSWIEWRCCITPFSHFHTNLIYLFNRSGIWYLPFSMAFMPLLWFVFYDYIPLSYRTLRYPCLIYFLSLLIVGHIWEARILSEIALILYLPVCAGCQKWLMNMPVVEEMQPAWKDWLNREMVLLILLLVLVLEKPLDMLLP